MDYAQEMIKAIAQSENKHCAEIANKILTKQSTIEAELLFTGRFMTSVLTGDYDTAIACADIENRTALKKHFQSIKS